MLPVGSQQVYQNKKLHNVLIGIGASMLITGIALACINHPAATALGGVTISLGTPLLLTGLVMTIIRKYQDGGDSPSGGTSGYMFKQGNASNGGSTAFQGGSHKLGGGKKSEGSRLDVIRRQMNKPQSEEPDTTPPQPRRVETQADDQRRRQLADAAEARLAAQKQQEE